MKTSGAKTYPCRYCIIPIEVNIYPGRYNTDCRIVCRNKCSKERGEVYLESTKIHDQPIDINNTFVVCVDSTDRIQLDEYFHILISIKK